MTARTHSHASGSGILRGLRRVFLLGLAASLGVLSLACAFPARAEPTSASIRHKLDDIVDAAMAGGSYPGLAVVIERDGEVIYAATRGYADLENAVQVTRDTVFPIGSITKTFTALATLQLAAAGKLSLDAPVGSLLPALPEEFRTVSIRHLLNHTSGVPDYTRQPDFPIDSQADLTPQQVLGYVAGTPLLFKPGTQFSYSNTDTYLLGLVVESVSGLSYREYLRRNVFEPFGMRRTYYADYRSVVAHRSRGYTPGTAPERFAGAPQYSASVAYSAGALQSTVDDLLRYRRGVFEGKLTSPEVRRLMLETDSLADGTHVYYALGCLIVRDFSGHRKISHSGVISGAAAHLAWYPDDHLVIAIAGNVDRPQIEPYSIEHRLARVVLGLPPAPSNVVQPTAAELDSFAGTYEVERFRFEAGRYGFVAKDGNLFLQYEGAGSGAPLMPLVYNGHGRFSVKSDTEHTFQFDVASPHARTVHAEFFDGAFEARFIEP